MKRPVIIDKDIELSEAAKIMSSKGIGSLIFTSSGKVKGILTEEDIMRNFGKQEKVSEAMTLNPMTITSGESIESALQAMRSKKVRRLPVVDKGKLVGIISMTDIIAHWGSLEVDEDFFFE